MTETRSKPVAHKLRMKTYRERYAAWGAFFGKAQATEKTALPSGRIEPNRSWRQRKGGLPDLWRRGDEVLGTLIKRNRPTVQLRSHSLELALSIFILVGLAAYSPA